MKKIDIENNIKSRLPDDDMITDEISKIFIKDMTQRMINNIQNKLTIDSITNTINDYIKGLNPIEYVGGLSGRIFSIKRFIKNWRYYYRRKDKIYNSLVFLDKNKQTIPITNTQKADIKRILDEIFVPNYKFKILQNKLNITLVSDEEIEKTCQRYITAIQIIFEYPDFIYDEKSIKEQIRNTYKNIKNKPGFYMEDPYKKSGYIRVKINPREFEKEVIDYHIIKLATEIKDLEHVAEWFEKNIDIRKYLQLPKYNNMSKEDKIENISKEIKIIFEKYLEDNFEFDVQCEDYKKAFIQRTILLRSKYSDDNEAIVVLKKSLELIFQNIGKYSIIDGPCGLKEQAEILTQDQIEIYRSIERIKKVDIINKNPDHTKAKQTTRYLMIETEIAYLKSLEMDNEYLILEDFINSMKVNYSSGKRYDREETTEEMDEMPEYSGSYSAKDSISDILSNEYGVFYIKDPNNERTYFIPEFIVDYDNLKEKEKENNDDKYKGEAKKMFNRTVFLDINKDEMEISNSKRKKIKKLIETKHYPSQEKRKNKTRKRIEGEKIFHKVNEEILKLKDKNDIPIAVVLGDYLDKIDEKIMSKILKETKSKILKNMMVNLGINQKSVNLIDISIIRIKIDELIGNDEDFDTKENPFVNVSEDEQKKELVKKIVTLIPDTGLRMIYLMMRAPYFFARPKKDEKSETDPFFTLDELSSLLGIAKGTIKGRIKEKIIPHLKAINVEGFDLQDIIDTLYIYLIDKTNKEV